MDNYTKKIHEAQIVECIFQLEEIMGNSNLTIEQKLEFVDCMLLGVTTICKLDKIDVEFVNDAKTKTTKFGNQFKDGDFHQRRIIMLLQYIAKVCQPAGISFKIFQPEGEIAHAAITWIAEKQGA